MCSSLASPPAVKSTKIENQLIYQSIYQLIRQKSKESLVTLNTEISTHEERFEIWEVNLPNLMKAREVTASPVPTQGLQDNQSLVDGRSPWWLLGVVNCSGFACLFRLFRSFSVPIVTITVRLRIFNCLLYDVNARIERHPVSLGVEMVTQWPEFGFGSVLLIFSCSYRAFMEGAALFSYRRWLQPA